MYYKEDRIFTDKMHKKYAIPFIYNKLKWKEQNIDDKLNEYQDIFSAIDYEFLDEKDCKILVQERFRKSKYSEFNDFTIRYERPENEEVLEQKSEFYKMKRYLRTCKSEFYLVYAFEPPYFNDTLKKFVIVDLKKLFKHIDDKEICILDGNENITDKCKMKIKVQKNRDKSSTFVSFDVNELISLFDDVIKQQIGFCGE